MIIIPRKAWGVRHPAGFGPAPPATELWLHHSVTASPGPNATEEQDAGSVRVLEDIGQQRFGAGISYTFVVTAAGRVLEGTGELRQGAHTAGRNSRARGIVLVGDHTRTRPTDAALQAVADLVRHGHALGWWTTRRITGGHRDAPGAATECPGSAAWTCIPVINSRALSAHLDDLEDDVTPEDSARLTRLEAGVTLILQQLVGPGATIANPFPGEGRGGGWEHWRHGTGSRRYTLVDYLRGVDREISSAFTLANRPVPHTVQDSTAGHLLSLRAELAQLRALIDSITRPGEVPR